MQVEPGLGQRLLRYKQSSVGQLAHELLVVAIRRERCKEFGLEHLQIAQHRQRMELFLCEGCRKNGIEVLKDTLPGGLRNTARGLRVRPYRQLVTKDAHSKCPTVCGSMQFSSGRPMLLDAKEVCQFRTREVQCLRAD